MFDFNGDGRQDLVVGYKDGFIRIYNIASGEVIKKVFTAPYPIKGLKILDDGKIAVISPLGLTVFDKKLNEICFQQLNADAVATLGSNENESIVVSDDQGVVHAFTLEKQ